MEDLSILLANDELLLLFLVILLGLLLGRLQIRGIRLGLAGVLFAGLGLTAWLQPHGPALRIAPELKEFGLVLFVYCVGLTSGPGFFAAWRSRGVRLNLVVLVALGCGAALAVLGGRLLGLDKGLIAGVFCGALTNTPALGAATDRLGDSALALQPVLGYSVTYPFGIFGALLAFRLYVRWSSVQLQAERKRHEQEQLPLLTVNLRVTNPAIVGHSIGELRVQDEVGVLVSRLRRADDVLVPTKYTVFQSGDIVVAVCNESTRPAAVAFFGEESELHLESERQRVDMRRVLVSRPEHVGCSIDELDLDRRFNAQVTRIRRADVDFVPTGDTRLAQGDRLRVVAPARRLREVSQFFGDSERQLAEVDYVALGLGLAAGLLLAHIPVPAFGVDLTLGAAGGPLIIALLLGRLSRTGPLVWLLPYEANRVVRDLGLLLFLAGVGVSAGASMDGVFTQEGLALLGLGIAVTTVTTTVALLLARFLAAAEVITSLGAASGMQTQPATLEAAFELSGQSNETYVSYALVYPVAMISKILIAQLLAVFA